ncbi:MAG: response regulator [Candidatus Methylomirabilales bacterium]
MARILVVEDDPDSAVVMQRMLIKGGGHQAEVTEDAARVVALCRAGSVDLVLMDVSLTNSRYQDEAVDGLELTRMLKGDVETAHIPVLLVTAHAMQEDRDRFLKESGADGYVVKPIEDYEGFLLTVNEILVPPQSKEPQSEGRAVVSPETRESSERRALSHALRKHFFSLKGSLELVLQKPDELHPSIEELVAIALRNTNCLMHLSEEILTAVGAAAGQPANGRWEVLESAEYVANPLEPQELLPHLEQMGQGGKKIIVADDDPDVVRVLRGFLEARGCEVIEAFDGKEVLEQAVQDRPDLLLLDLDMPRMDGYEVLFHLRRNEELKHIPVVIFSGCDWGREKIAKELGAKEYFRKQSRSKLIKESYDAQEVSDRG